MPTLETPPNPLPTPEPDGLQNLSLHPEQMAPIKVRAGRFGELDHTELVHLLDSLDDDRSRSRFRESIYISFIVYLALGWFIFYGPKVLFHQGRIINAADVLKQRDKELTFLETPKDLSKLTPPKDSKVISDHTARAQTAHPTLDKKTLEELQRMRKAGPEAAAPPRPLPPTPQPQQQAPAPQQQQAPPQQQARQQPPAPPTPSNIPDAPHPSPSTRPNFSTPSTAGDLVRDAANAAARNRSGGGGEGGANAPASHAGANTGFEVLSDTMGVDFGPYIKRILRLIKAQWYSLIPEECYPPLNKEGVTLIRFSILPNGNIAPGSMHLDNSTRDIAIDKAAWGGITGVGQMPPLPSDFKGDNLTLRIQFTISHDRSQAD